MKKLFLFAIVFGLILALPSWAATEIKFKTGQDTVTLKPVDGEGYANNSVADKQCYQIFVNGNALEWGKEYLANTPEMSSEMVYCGLTGSDGLKPNNIYKTNINGLIVINHSAGDMSMKTEWDFINVKNGNIKLNVAQSGDFVNEGSVKIEINGLEITDHTKNVNCDDGSISSVAQANKAKVVFDGFDVAGQFLYKAAKNSMLKCVYGTFHEGDDQNHAYGMVADKEILGVNRDFKQVYFSGHGKDWIAYYTYNIKTNKITKTTLTNINKNKVKLTLVKTF